MSQQLVESPAAAVAWWNYFLCDIISLTIVEEVWPILLVSSASVSWGYKVIYILVIMHRGEYEDVDVHYSRKQHPEVSMEIVSEKKLVLTVFLLELWQILFFLNVLIWKTVHHVNFCIH